MIVRVRLRQRIGKACDLLALGIPHFNGRPRLGQRIGHLQRGNQMPAAAFSDQEHFQC